MMHRHFLALLGLAAILAAVATAPSLADDAQSGTAKAAGSTRPSNQIGYVGLVLKGATITKVLQDTPAAQNSLAPGDVIESVDGIATSGMKGDEVSRRIRGPLASKVTIVIKRSGQRFACVLPRSLTANDEDRLEHPSVTSTSTSKLPPGMRN